MGFEKMVDEFTPMIHHVMKSLHIYKNHDDFVQIGRIALWEASQRYEAGKGVFSNYAYSYMKGGMMSALTHAKKTEEKQIYPTEVFWDSRMDHNSEVPLEMEMLLSYCTGLTVKEECWLIHTFYYGRSINEIAAIENVSPSAVKKWRKQAIDKLRKTDR